MSSVPFLQSLAKREPWRQGLGLPANALDPTWVPGPGDFLCTGDVEWEGSTRWWICQKCGRIGSMTRQEHKPVQHPMSFLLEAVQFFMSKHPDLPQGEVIERMAFIAGASLRYAAVQPDLTKYVDSLVTR